MFAWITCPLALRRFARDTGAVLPELVKLDEQTCLSASLVVLDGSVVLEEYRIKTVGDVSGVTDLLLPLSKDAVWKSLPERLVVLSDEMFSFFVEQACEVVSHIRIDDETGVVAKGALFNQEQVPSETLFYTTVIADESRFTEAENAFKSKLTSGFFQVGGDASTGLGYCSVEVL
jgi:CRISPR-associated protein Cmr4